MYNVLLVDDEPLALEGLRDFIPWEEYNFQVQGCALNVNQACAMIAGQTPDLVITDICMPERNGIDLIASLKKAAPETRVIILSGYDEFEYARDALQYGAAAYLLKPVDRTELCGLLSEVRDALEEKRKLRQTIGLHEKNVQKYIDGILAGHPDEKAGIHADAFFDVCQNGQRVCFFELGLFFPLDSEPDTNTLRSRLKEELAREFAIRDPFALVTAGVERWLLIVRWENTEEELLSRLRGIADSIGRFGWELAVYEGGAGKTHNDYAEKIKQCRLCADRLFYPTPENESVAKAMALSQEKGWELDSLYRQKVSPLLVRAAVQKLVRTIPEPSGKLVPRFLRQLERLSFSQICRGLLRLQAAAEEAPPCGEKTVDQVLAYIREHYREDLQLHKLAEQFYFNANYLGKVLRQHLRVSFREYIHELRTEEAKRLLAENRMQVSEIAEHLGYRDADTFSERFRKIVGQSPSSYRKERLGL